MNGYRPINIMFSEKTWFSIDDFVGELGLKSKAEFCRIAVEEKIKYLEDVEFLRKNEKNEKLAVTAAKKAIQTAIVNLQVELSKLEYLDSL